MVELDLLELGQAQARGRAVVGHESPLTELIGPVRRRNLEPSSGPPRRGGGTPRGEPRKLRSTSRRSCAIECLRLRWCSTIASCRSSARLVLHEIVEMEVLVGAAVLAHLVAEEGALDHQHAALRKPRREVPDARAGVAAVGEPDLFADSSVDLDPPRAERAISGPASAAKPGLQPPAAAQEVEPEARHDVVGREGLDREVAADLDPVSGRQRHELVAVRDPLEPLRRGDDQRRERRRRSARGQKTRVGAWWCSVRCERTYGTPSAWSRWPWLTGRASLDPASAGDAAADVEARGPADGRGTRSPRPRRE